MQAAVLRAEAGVSAPGQVRLSFFACSCELRALQLPLLPGLTWQRAFSIIFRGVEVLARNVSEI